MRTKPSETIGGAICLPAVVLDICAPKTPPGSADASQIALFVAWGIEYYPEWWKAGPKLAVLEMETVESAVVVCREEGPQLVTDDRESEERLLKLSATSVIWWNCENEIVHDVDGPWVQEGARMQAW